MFGSATSSVWSDLSPAIFAGPVTFQVSAGRALTSRPGGVVSTGELVFFASDQTVNGLGIFLDPGPDLEHFLRRSHDGAAGSGDAAQVAPAGGGPPFRWTDEREPSRRSHTAALPASRCSPRTESMVRSWPSAARGRVLPWLSDHPSQPSPQSLFGDWLSGPLLHRSTLPPYGVSVDS